MRILKRNTTLRQYPSYVDKIRSITSKLNLDIEIFIVDTQNFIFHVNVDMDILIHSEDEALITKFDNLV